VGAAVSWTSLSILNHAKNMKPTSPSADGECARERRAFFSIPFLNQNLSRRAKIVSAKKIPGRE